MLTIRPSEVPTFLHSSKLYATLDLESDDEFQVPEKNAKFSLELKSFPDVEFLLDTLDYWNSDEIFPEVLNYLFEDRKSHGRICRWNYAGKTIPKYVRAIGRACWQPYDYHKLNRSLTCGVLEVLVFLRGKGLGFNHDSIRIAIRSKSIECLRYVISEGITDLQVEKICRNRLGTLKQTIYTELVPTNEDIEMIKYCIAQGVLDVLTADACAIAAEFGDLSLLQQLHELRCPWDTSACAKAARGGHLSCLIYAHENGAPWDEKTCMAAATGKHMDCLTYAVEQGCPADDEVSRLAIVTNDLEMLMFAHENLLPWEEDMCMLAARVGNLRCLTYLHEAGNELTAETCSAAAQNSNLDCLKYAHENGAPWSSCVYLCAMRNIAYEVMEYAFLNGCPIDRDVCLRIIKRGFSSDFVRVLIQHNFPLHADMCRVAAKYEDLDVLRLLHEAGCPWTVNTTYEASRQGHLPLLHYAASHGCPVEVVSCSCSVLPQHFWCMKYVFDNHSKKFDSIAAVIHDHFDCFRYAHDHGCPITEDIVVCAARLGRLNFLRYVFQCGIIKNQQVYWKYLQRARVEVENNGHTDCCSYLDALYALLTHRPQMALPPVSQGTLESCWQLIWGSVGIVCYGMKVLLRVVEKSNFHT